MLIIVQLKHYNMANEKLQQMSDTLPYQSVYVCGIYCLPAVLNLVLRITLYCNSQNTSHNLKSLRGIHVVFNYRQVYLTYRRTRLSGPVS